MEMKYIIIDIYINYIYLKAGKSDLHGCLSFSMRTNKPQDIKRHAFFSLKLHVIGDFMHIYNAF